MARGGPRSMYMEKGKKINFSALLQLFKYFKHYLFPIILSILFAAVSALASVFGPGQIKELANLIFDGAASLNGVDMDKFYEIFIILIIIYGGGAIVSLIQQLITTEITQRTSKILRSDINHKINRLPLNYFDTTLRGDLLSRVTNDVDSIAQSLGSTIASIVNAFALFIGVVIAMFVVNWELALITIGSSLLGIFAMFFFVGRSQKYFNRRQKILGDINGQIEETYTNINIVRSFDAKEEEIKEFNEKNDGLFNTNRKSQFLSGLMHPIMNFTGNLSYALIFIISVAMITSGRTDIDYGTIMRFVIYARLFTQPLTTFAQSLTSLQQASAAASRVFEFLNEKELADESEKTETLQNVQGTVDFENVKFGYVEDKIIIKGFTSHIKKGQKIAIVGPTGAGKTTIVNLLMRFYEINEGKILIDGVDTRDITRENVHDLFDMILQDTWLFSGTIRDNLKYNKKDVTDEEIIEALNTVGLDYFLDTLENGLDSIIDEHLNLSEGQKQQLTIARAIIKDSPLLILDEATSSVDTRTEIIIQKAMDKLTEGRTSFVIAHRLSTIKNADLILVLKDGNIIEQGTHKELLEANGFYAELYNSQFEIIE